MLDTIIQGGKKVVDQLSVKKVQVDHSLNLWMMIAFIEFGIIVYFLIYNKSKAKDNSKKKFKEEALKNMVDFDNILNSSFNSLQLYDQLKVKCHPDKFPNDPILNSYAVIIYQEISHNKTNIKRLLEIKEEAKLKLNINF